MTTTVARGARVCVRSPVAPGAARSAVPGLGAGLSGRRWIRGRGKRHGDSMLVRAESEEFDFDAVLNKLADKFDKVENKPALIGYGVGGLVAFLFVEWLIHLPLLDFVLGFPAQTLGVLIAPYLIIRYAVDKEDISADVEMVVNKVLGNLPGQN